jgi:hypothetical protein
MNKKGKTSPWLIVGVVALIAILGIIAYGTYQTQIGDQPSAISNVIETGDCDTAPTITVAAAVDAVAGDKLMFVAPKLTLGNKVTRTVADPDAKTVVTFFQKFG